MRKSPVAWSTPVDDARLVQVYVTIDESRDEEMATRVEFAGTRSKFRTDRYDPTAPNGDVDRCWRVYSGAVEHCVTDDKVEFGDA